MYPLGKGNFPTLVQKHFNWAVPCQHGVAGLYCFQTAAHANPVLGSYSPCKVVERGDIGHCSCSP